MKKKKDETDGLVLDLVEGGIILDINRPWVNERVLDPSCGVFL